MTEYLYTRHDRIEQLQALASALRELIPVVESLSEFAARAEEYLAALETADHLLKNGFTQEQVLELGRSIPDLFYRYREWEPPLERHADGTRQEPEWFRLLEPKLQKVLSASEKLRTLGYY